MIDQQIILEFYQTYARANYEAQVREIAMKILNQETKSQMAKVAKSVSEEWNAIVEDI